MTATTHFASANRAARHARGAQRIAGTAVVFTPHRHNRDEVARELTEFAGRGSCASPKRLESTIAALRYPKMTGFFEASNA
jgi:alkylresorcinol/alkylpyrone synthase